MTAEMNYLVPIEKLQSIREAVYSILTSANDQVTPDVALTQTNAVAVSNSMKKDGVTIINSQSVVVQNITLAAVEMLRAIDDLPPVNQVVEAEVEQTPYNGASGFLEDCLHRRLTLRQVTDKISDLYTQFVGDFNDGDAEETRKMLGVRKTRMLSL